jgi:hypothetical protein
MAGLSALNAANTCPMITIRLAKYKPGDTRLIIVNGPPQRKTTFSKCMNIIMERMETNAEIRHSHNSTVVGKAVFQDMRWRAPKEAPKRQVNGQIFDLYKLGSH